MGYPRERKEAVLKKMLPPCNKPRSEIVKEEGISESALYNWREASRAEGRLMPDGDTSPSGWGPSDKFAAVLKATSMNQAELKSYQGGRTSILTDRRSLRLPYKLNRLMAI